MWRLYALSDGGGVDGAASVRSICAGLKLTLENLKLRSRIVAASAGFSFLKSSIPFFFYYIKNFIKMINAFI